MQWSFSPKGQRVFRSGQCFPVQSFGQLFPTFLGCSSFLCISLLLYGFVSSTMPTESSSPSSPSSLFSSSVSSSFQIISPEPDNAVDVPSSPQFSLKLAQNSLREIFHHQIFGEHNAFESTRYGLRIDHCPNGGEPEVSEQDGRIKLCQLDAECKPTFKCENIVGLTHFGKQMRFCCPTKISVCTLKPKLATDVSSFPAGCHRPPLRTFYYFDVDRQRCAKGRMAQCEGFGDNRFATELECRTKCETTACEFGESILLHNDSFDSPFLCSSDDDCPVGYNCRQDHIFRRSACCGFLNFGVCPHGHQAYIHPLTDGTIKCNLRNFDPTTSCPPGYVCLEAVFGSIWGFCCAQTGSHPQINLITNQPQRCELTQQPSVCTSEFECETDEATHLGFCCSIRRHEKVKPTAEPMARKRTKTAAPTHTTRNTTEEMPMTTTITTTIIKENRAEEEIELIIGTSNSNSVENERKRRPQSNEMGRESARKGEGRQRKRGRWKERKARKRGRQRGESHSSSSSSSEQSEKADLMELSTKLDRFISGVRRRAKLPKGHRRTTRPKQRNGNRNRTKWDRREKMGNIFGKREHGRRRRKSREEKHEEVEKSGRRNERMGEGEGRDEEKGGNGREEEERQKGEIAQREYQKRRRGNSKIPKCPHGFRPMNYPGTRWTFLECVMDEEWKFMKRRRKTKRRKQKEKTRRSKRKKRRGNKEWEDEVEEEEAEEQQKRGDEPHQHQQSEGDTEDEWETERRKEGTVQHKRKREEEETVQHKRKTGEEEEEEEDETVQHKIKRGEEEEEEEDETVQHKIKRGEEEEEEDETVQHKRKTGEEEEEEKDEIVQHKIKRGEEEEEEDETVQHKRKTEEEEEEKDEIVHHKRKRGEEEEEEEDKSAVCPRGSICLNALDDPFGRALCCVKRGKHLKDYKLGMEEMKEEEDKFRKERKDGDEKKRIELATEMPTAAGPMALKRSTDQACPFLIAGRICQPGSTDICVEDGFFCQYNKERRAFVCCTFKEADVEGEQSGRKRKEK
ncbi:hypothetical protein niasHS_009316 [Heterodera schachtii]|uniref:BPTI/Kunitz inhibitor domain-containing protein n=1 Tax=Heterodera schachtii TaxID=97005 RepID=A0ABD2JBR3_HETSC